MDLSFSQALRFHLFSQSPLLFICRDEATRTPDPYVPNVVRYQLRYIPISRFFSAITALGGVSRRSFTGVNSHPRDLPALFSPKINFEILSELFGDHGVGLRFSSVIYRSKLPSSRLARLVLTENKLRNSFRVFGDNGVVRRFLSVIYRSKLPSSRLACSLRLAVLLSPK